MVDSPAGYVHHLDFTPRIELARLLAGDPATRPHCMIDLSDGLGQDLTRLCEQSGVHAEIDIERLPISDAAGLAAQRSGRPGWRHTLGDGEDYELCFTAPPNRIPASVGGVPVTPVGRIIEPGTDARVTARLPDGKIVNMAGLGWEHTG